MLGSVTVSRDAIIENCRAIAAAADLPVNADLENGGADDPKEAAKAIGLAAEAGAVGGSIEDATGDPRNPIYDFALAVERVHAAVEATRALKIPFMLTARAETCCTAATISTTPFAACRRLKPPAPTCCMRRGCTSSRTIKTVVSSIGKPFNLVMGCRPHADGRPALRRGRQSASASAARCRAWQLAAFLRQRREMRTAVTLSAEMAR